MRSRIRSTVMATMGVALLSSTLMAESFNESVSILEVQVPVQVTLGSTPVRDLTVENFEVYDKGVQQEVIAFEVIDLSSSMPTNPSQTGSSTTNSADSSPPDGRNLLLLFDFAHSPQFGLKRALTGARVMIKQQLHAADRAAVAYYTESQGVVFVVGFTPERPQLNTALHLIEEMLNRDGDQVQAVKAELDRLRGGDEAGQMASSFGWPAVLAMGEGALPTSTGGSGGQGAALSVGAPLAGGFGRFSDGGPRLAGGISSSFANSAEDLLDDAIRSSSLSNIRAFSEAISDVATLLRDVTGPRHLLLFSSGFGGINPSGDSTKLYELGKIRRAFLRSGWALHTVSLSGGNYPMSGNDSLFFMANETGGRLYENYNEFENATEKFLESSSVTYLLTFQPSHLIENGHRHKINVKLTGGPRGARLKHRPAYYAPKPVLKRNGLEQRLDAVAKIFSDEEVELIAADSLVVALRSPTTISNPQPGRVPVLVEIEGASLLTGQFTEDLKIEIQGYALNSAGGVADFFVKQVDLELAEVRERLRREGMRFYADLELPPGEFRLRLMVLNKESRRYSLATVPVTVAGRSDRAMVLPPLFVDLEKTPLTIQETAEAQHVFDLDGEPLFPTTRPRIAQGSKWPIYVAGYHVNGAFEARVVTADGTAIDQGRILIDQRLPEYEGGLERYMGTFEPEGLELGDYRLEVHGPEGSLASTNFRIVATSDQTGTNPDSSFAIIEPGDGEPTRHAR